MRRVVITGMGVINALGNGVEENWKKLISSTSGIKIIDSFKIDDMPSKIAGVIEEDIINKSFEEKETRKQEIKISLKLIEKVPKKWLSIPLQMKP